MRKPSGLLLAVAAILLLFSALSCNYIQQLTSPAAPSATATTAVGPAETEPLIPEPTDTQPPTQLPAPSATAPEEAGPTETEPPIPEPTDTQPPVPEPTNTQPPAPTAEEAPPEPEVMEPLGDCADEVCLLDGSFLLQRPIGPDGRNIIVTSNRFGEYRRATRDSYHGVYFLNSTGTPVLAAAAGRVVVAGDDLNFMYGPFRNLYGSLVILEHELPQLTGPVYTLYGHLSEVSVAEGDTVGAGQQIGRVGSSGSIQGSTLVFEIRYPDMNYASARNPELWLQPLPDDRGELQGAIAGRITDGNGNYLRVSNIVIERLAGPGLPALDQFYLRTYAESRLVGQLPWKENFAIGDLPAGEYQITFWLNGLQQRVVEVKPGDLTIVNFTVR